MAEQLIPKRVTEAEYDSVVYKLSEGWAGAQSLENAEAVAEVVDMLRRLWRDVREARSAHHRLLVASVTRGEL